MESVENVMESVKTQIRAIMRRFASVIDKISGGKITPNTITWSGLLAHIFIAYLITLQEYNWAAVLLIIFGLFDTLDGELARLQGKDSPSGMFLDSLTDRMKEILLYVGISYSIIAIGRPYMAVWAIAAAGVSLLITYVNAWGEVCASRNRHTADVNKKFRGGLMGFEVRMFVLVLGLLSGRLILATIVITILGIMTVAQRYEKVMNVLDADDKD